MGVAMQQRDRKLGEAENVPAEATASSRQVWTAETGHHKLRIVNAPRCGAFFRVAELTVMATERCEEYTHYAEHCLAMARVARDQQSRMIQREMAAEWLRLAGMLESEQAAGSIPVKRLNGSHDA
jgi:hypothetical protein